MMKKSALAFSLLTFLWMSAWPQTQGRIDGRVLDAAGAPVDKAEVSIVSQRTVTVHYDLKTDKDGRFIQVGVTPGYYVVTCKKTGFAPSSSEVHVMIAETAKFETRLKPVDAASQKTLSKADELFLKGNSLYGSGKLAEAAAAYGEAVAIEPGSWRTHFNLGLTYKKMGRPEDALAEFSKAVGISPESYSANKEMGEALAKSGKFAEARPYYEKAVSLSPDDPDARYNFGVCLINAGESEAALPQFQKTVELKPDYAEAYYQIGTILIGQNKVPEAVASLEKFLQLAPEHEKAGVAKQLLQALKK